MFFSISFSKFFELQACHATVGGAAALPRHCGWRYYHLCHATHSGAAALSRHCGWRHYHLCHATLSGAADLAFEKDDRTLAKMPAQHEFTNISTYNVIYHIYHKHHIQASYWNTI
jgi:hypothetical protein